MNHSQTVPRQSSVVEEEEEGEEVEGLGQAETYNEYMPSKCKLISSPSLELLLTSLKFVGLLVICTSFLM